MKLKFGQLFSAYVLQKLWIWILVEILKLGLVKILNLKFYREADVDWVDGDSENEIKICVWTCDMNSTVGSVVPLAMFKTMIYSHLEVGHHCRVGVSPQLRSREGALFHLAGYARDRLIRRHGTHSFDLKDNCIVCHFVILRIFWLPGGGGGHNGRTVAPEAILFESPCRAHPET